MALAEDVIITEITEVTLDEDQEVPLFKDVSQPTKIDNNDGEISFYTIAYDSTTYLLSDGYKLDKTEETDGSNLLFFQMPPRMLRINKIGS